ncbi:AraC family transcriptional regulator [Vandammella animalimorsus]|uniref:AraC family transcriptional regulator n=2 Tax=Vandammella animalimorsus TaxID=2029117 RepID=A0A2A2AGV6_9BURK|nr:AraC family transcriptional regulator [Vandammella animalimorsus]
MKMRILFTNGESGYRAEGKACGARVNPQAQTFPMTSFHCIQAHSGGRQAGELSLHTHEEGLLFMLTGGLIHVETERQAWCASPGHLGWIAPGVPHRAQWHGVAGGIFLYLHPRHCAPLPAEGATVRLTPLAEALMRRLLALRRGCAAADWAPDSASDATLEAVPGQDATGGARIAALIELLLGELQDGLPAALPGLPLPRSAALQALAQAFLAAPDSADDLPQWARRARMSASTLQRRFKAETGLSPSHWRQRARLMRAQELLAGGASVTAAAMHVGYGNVSAFIEAFARHFGATPGQYLQAGAAAAE